MSLASFLPFPKRGSRSQGAADSGALDDTLREVMPVDDTLRTSRAPATGDVPGPRTSPARAGARPPEVTLRVGTATCQGPRPKNDDFCAASLRHDFFAISDGIGGAPHGEIVSQIAVNAAVETYDQVGEITAAFEEANRAASDAAHYLAASDGATLLLAESAAGRLAFVGVGDTRCYRLRAGSLELVTGSGRRGVGPHNALDKAVGYGPIPGGPDTDSVELAAGDRFALVSDGVWDYLAPERLAALLDEETANAPLIADSICHAAIDAGGRDNATCICLIVDAVRT